MQRTTFDIPNQRRRAANDSIEQARKAIDQVMDATHKAVAKAEGSAMSMREGTADVQRQAMGFVEENIAASFDFAEKLVRARSVEEIVALQQDFVSRHMRSAAEQGKSLGEMMGRAASDAVAKAKPTK